MEEWLAVEKQMTIENTPAAADGGDRSAMAAPLSNDSLKSKRKVVEDDCSSSKSKKPKISKGKRKVDDCDSKGVIKKQKVSIKKTGPKFKRPLDFSYFETAEDLEVLGMRRLQNELLDRGKSCKDTLTLQERAAKLFEFKLDFPEVNELFQIYDKLQQKWIQLPC